MYVCPDCKRPLERLYCKRCAREYTCVDGIPVLFSHDPKFQSAPAIATAYDSIYHERTNVWENQGKTPAFIDYFSSFLNRFRCNRILEVGCGEGFLLASLNRGEKFAVDLSIQALKMARARVEARFSLALAERLPFPSAYFDLVTSVGVMEHFLDIREATEEIRRVLRPGGRYVALTHVDLTFGERLAQKIREYVFPRPRPIRLAQWLRWRLTPRPEPDFPKQPIQNRNSTRSAKVWFEDNGLEVIDVIHTRKYPTLPLMGPWVVIYVTQKQAPRE